MNLLCFTLLFACQNPQVGFEVEVLTDQGAVRAPFLGWQNGHPQLDSQAAMESWWVVEFPHPLESSSDWKLSLVDGAWLPGHPVVGSPVPAWQLANLPEVPPLELDPLWLLACGRNQLPQRNDARDELWQRTTAGSLDRLHGYLLEWTPAGIRFETTTKERFVTWEQVDALAVLPEALPVQAESVWVQLKNGGVLSARILKADSQQFLLQLPWGVQWSIPVHAVTRIRQRKGVEEWALQAWNFEELPQTESLDWKPRVGQSIEGRPLRLRKGVLAQGIGVHVPTILGRQTPSAGIFMATVGVDAEVSNFRHPQPVRFQVLFQGEILADSGFMTVENSPRRFLVPVPGPGHIQLRAIPAAILPFGGHADWGDLLWKAAPN